MTLKKPNFTIEVLDRSSLINRGVLDFIWEDIAQKQKVIHTALGQIVFSIECSDCPKPDELLETISNITRNFIHTLMSTYNISHTTKFPLKIAIWDFLYSHMGLGSKTQMALAIASSITKIMELNANLDILTLTRMVGRGGTSGIGYRSFESGGFILDCGHRFGKDQEKDSFLPSSASRAEPARTILRYDFPENWHILVVILNVPAGASNKEEVNIFQKHCPIPLEEVQQVTHHILMQLLPGIIEKDLFTFGQALNAIRKIGFKKIEIDLQHEQVKKLIQFLEKHDSKCVGMSSFGPTVFSIFESEDDAIKILEKIKTSFTSVGFTSFITTANNTGAYIEETPE